MSQYIGSAPAQIQAQPASVAQYEHCFSASMHFQGMPFPGTYMANANWHMLVPNLLPQAKGAPPTMLSERQLLILQCEKALKRQKLQARELEDECKTQALKLTCHIDMLRPMLFLTY